MFKVIWGLILFTLFGVMSCQSSEYETVLKREAARGIRNDSLFLGLNFGDSRDTFFNRCRRMNQSGVCADGGGTAPGITVLHIIDTPTFNAKVNMNFYPLFDKAGKISEMPVRFAYSAYFPYTSQFQTDVLLPKVVTYLETHYGKFIDITKPGKDTIFANVNANRRILVRKLDDQYVSVIFSDLSKKQ